MMDGGITRPNVMMETNTFHQGHGLFALWEGAQPKRAEILADLAAHFEILGTYEVHWSDRNYVSNYERLYERPQSGKTFTTYNKKLGKPPFTLVVVRDPNPVLRHLISVSGSVEICNKNIVDAKYRYRDMFDRPYLVHSSNNLEEFLFQAAVLLGPARLQALLESSEPAEEILHKDLEGADGWDDWHHFFSVANYADANVVLRNHDELLHGMQSGDVDFLCSNLQRFCSAGNIFQKSEKRYKGHVVVAKHRTKCDIRFVGDGYMPEAWQTDILATRERGRVAYEPCRSELYFSLLFHICLHKSSVPKKYVVPLHDLEAKLGVQWRDQAIDTRDGYIPIIAGFLKSKNYLTSRPIDAAVQIEADAWNAFPRTTDFQKMKLRDKVRQKLFG